MCKACHSFTGRYDEIENREADELKQKTSKLEATHKVITEARLVLKESGRIALSKKGPRMKALAAALEEYDAAK